MSTNVLGYALSAISNPMGLFYRSHCRYTALGYGWIIKRLFSKSPRTRDEWLEYYRPKQAVLDVFRETVWPENAPIIDVIIHVPHDNVHLLDKTIASIREQTYSRVNITATGDVSHVKAEGVTLIPASPGLPLEDVYRLCLSSSPTSITCFLSAGDTLEKHALHRISESALQDDGDIFYADEFLQNMHAATLDTFRLHGAFSYNYFLAYPYFTMLAAKTSVLREALSKKRSIRCLSLYDICLVALEHSRRVTHINDILLAREQEHVPDSAEHDIAVRKQHLAACGMPDAEVSVGAVAGTYKIRFNIPKPAPRIAIIIPTRDKASLLRQCVSSLKDTGALEHSDLFIINHLSVEPETALYLEEIKASLRATVIDYDGVFNFSYMNNLAVNKLPRPYDYYLFLNNDVYATTPGWLESMLDIAVRKDIGIVGATLLYPKGTVQHAGVVVGPMGIATHAHYMKPFYASADTPVENNWDVSLFCVADYSAVTAAAMLVKADAFRRVGGYDESLQVGFGDTGLCLSVGRLGLGVVNTPDAVLYHHESASRGRPEYGVDDHWRDTLRFRQKYADIFTHADPYHNTLLAMHQLNPLLQSLRRCRVACNTRTVDVNIHQN